MVASKFGPIVFLAVAMTCAGVASCADPKAASLRQAHAHNDYLHKRPLLDALENGFSSVEADVYLVEGELLVAHTRLGLLAKRSLRTLYLDPLRERVKANGGSVHGDDRAFTLLIDIKADGKATYRALSSLLAEYKEIFTSVEDGVPTERAVTAIISGDRAVETIKSDSPRYAGIDGRLSDLDSDRPAHLLPLISDHWGRNFRWRGVGEMTASDRDKLAGVIEKAHRKNRRVRFWATPDTPEVWGVLREAGVDLINADDLEGLSRFLREASDHETLDR